MAVKLPIVTIDGPSGAGKSTISRMVAARLHFTYLDTGAMYRAVGLAVERQGIDLADSVALKRALDTIRIELLPNEHDDVRVILNGEDISAAIRTPAMGMVASRVSALPLVREKLTELQRGIGSRGGIVAEGRDMGTVVFPDAPFKFYLDASPAERARRRCDQLRQKGQAADYQEILDQIVKRDYDDSKRTLAPLKPAADAIIVDSSAMGPEAVVAFMLRQMGKAQALDTEENGMAEEESRAFKRRHLIYYLEVYDDATGTLLGHLVDITTEGVKLVSKAPIEKNRVYRLRMQLPEDYFDEKVLRFEATSLWSSNDVNPDFYDTGFRVTWKDKRAKNIVAGLVGQFGFND
jgi:cytidylate kinase